MGRLIPTNCSVIGEYNLSIEKLKTICDTIGVTDIENKSLNELVDDIVKWFDNYFIDNDVPITPPPEIPPK